MLSSLNNFHGEELASDAFIETISLELDVVIEKAKTNNHLPTPPPLLNTIANNRSTTELHNSRGRREAKKISRPNIAQTSYSWC